MTVLFSVCPLGNEGLDSNGGTASAVGGPHPADHHLPD